jgi:hypothetical protein
VLEVGVGRYVDTSLVRADVRPRLVRLLVKGRLLVLALPQEARGAEDGRRWGVARVGRALPGVGGRVGGLRGSPSGPCGAGSIA